HDAKKECELADSNSYIFPYVQHLDGIWLYLQFSSIFVDPMSVMLLVNELHKRLAGLVIEQKIQYLDLLEWMSEIDDIEAPPALPPCFPSPGTVPYLKGIERV